MRTRYRDIPASPTKDGSHIRGLMPPALHGNRARSRAAVTVLPWMARRVVNPRAEPLHILCCSSPACAHDDTELQEA